MAALLLPPLFLLPFLPFDPLDDFLEDFLDLDLASVVGIGVSSMMTVETAESVRDGIADGTTDALSDTDVDKGPDPHPVAETDNDHNTIPVADSNKDPVVVVWTIITQWFLNKIKKAAFFQEVLQQVHF